MVMDIREIQEYQENRFPWLFIDRVTELVPGQRVKGYKNLTMNEWFFPTHFQGDPLVPGMVTVEALAQTFIMTFLTLPGYKGQPTNFIRADNVVFKARLVPGDRLDIEAELQSFNRGLARGWAEGRVEGRLACRAELTIGLPRVIEQYAPKPPAAG